MKIIYKNFGIAYRVGNTIEINAALKNYPKLLKEVIQHEENHSAGQGIDFLHDLRDMVKATFNPQWWSFGFRHPLAYLQSGLPIWKQDGRWNYNLFLVVFYLSFFAILSAGVVMLHG